MQVDWIESVEAAYGEMDGWFLTFDEGDGRESVFAFVDDLTQDEVDTLHDLLSQDILDMGESYQTYSCDFLIEDDRAMLIRFRREWSSIKAELDDPELDAERLAARPWYKYYALYLEYRDEILKLRPFYPDPEQEDEEDDEEDDYSPLDEALLDVVVDMNIAKNPALLHCPKPEATVPKWDGELMVLYWGKQVARRVNGIAKNVLAVLTAFQEDGWPPRIDDPLRGGRNPERLRDTVKQLNKDLKFVRFASDGSGVGITWVKVDTGETTALD